MTTHAIFYEDVDCNSTFTGITTDPKSFLDQTEKSIQNDLSDYDNPTLTRYETELILTDNGQELFRYSIKQLYWCGSEAVIK